MAATMASVSSSMRSLMEMFLGKTQEFLSEIDNVHMVWLEEIQQEANRMFSRDFNTEPELMPKTPSQRKKSRRKRVSLGRQEESQASRLSKGRRSNLRGSVVKPLSFTVKEDTIPEASTSAASCESRPKRTTRKNKQTQSQVADGDSQLSCDGSETEEVQQTEENLNVADIKPKCVDGTSQFSPKIPSPEVAVRISAEERLSAEFAKKAEASTGRAASKIAIAGMAKNSGRCSLKLRYSLAGLRHSMTQEAVRRSSRRSMLKRKAARKSNSSCASSVTDDDSSMDAVNEEDVILEVSPADLVDNNPPKTSKENSQMLQPNERVGPSFGRITRSVAANSPKLAPPSLFSPELKVSAPVKTAAEKRQASQTVRRSNRSSKRKAPDTVENSPSKRFSPPKKSHSTIKPNMRSFLHTVQKNQILMMTPNSSGRSGVIRSFIKHATPVRIDPKTKERHRLEALKKKQEQEEERMRKMEEEKKRKQEELKRKRDERIKRVFEAKVKEEQREEEKKKKIEQKMAQIDGKNEKRVAEEKKKLAMKRQEELEQKRRLEEEAKKKKIQQAEEEKRQQELAAKKKVEEEEEQQARKALELKMEQERERERKLEKERQAAAEREKREKEKALALQRELEKAAREKEMRDLEEKRKALEEKRKLEEQQRLAAKEQALKEREVKLKEADPKLISNLNATFNVEDSVVSTPAGKGAGLNVTVDLKPYSPQSYAITPKAGNKTSKDFDDYGMDQNSDDSTDDESAPRKPIPSWAEGPKLMQILRKQYFSPPNLASFLGDFEPPRLEHIFYKSKPRYFKRTSSAVWHSPPSGAK